MSLEFDLPTVAKTQTQSKENANGKLENKSESHKMHRTLLSIFHFFLHNLVTNDTSVLRGWRNLLSKRPRIMKAQRKTLGTHSRSAKSSHPRMFPCHLESCGKIFSDRASLKKHLTVHGDKLVSFVFNWITGFVVLMYLSKLW